jgi:hypothetical protein
MGRERVGGELPQATSRSAERRLRLPSLKQEALCVSCSESFRRAEMLPSRGDKALLTMLAVPAKHTRLHKRRLSTLTDD